MSNVLVVAELKTGTISKATRTAITFAKAARARVGGEIHILVIGHNVDDAAKDAARFAAVVHKADAPAFASPTAEAYAKAIVAAQKAADANVVAMAATFQGKDVLPRAAALLGAGMASDVMAFAAPDGFSLLRAIQAGNVIATVEITTPIKCVSTRPTEFGAAEPESTSGDVRALAVDVGTLGTRYVKFDAVKSTRPALGDARVVVSGGRGIKEAANFQKLIEPLADKLKAATGASRAIVDAGWVPNDLQVGQTGKVVAPDLYFAIGISGAIQHVAGMKGSKVIVAINKDAEAPIFQVADYGIVGDLFKVVPELIEKL